MKKLILMNCALGIFVAGCNNGGISSRTSSETEVYLPAGQYYGLITATASGSQCPPVTFSSTFITNGNGPLCNTSTAICMTINLANNPCGTTTAGGISQTFSNCQFESSTAIMTAAWTITESGISCPGNATFNQIST